MMRQKHIPWWYQHALGLICQGLAVEGLEFVDTEIACLDGEKLETAFKALEQILQTVRDGIPYLEQDRDGKDSLWYLHTYWDDGERKTYTTEIVRKAFDESQALYDIDVEQEFGYESIVGFFSFLKSLQATMSECLNQAMCLLYIQPQP
jgi:hypothetical protein